MLRNSDGVDVERKISLLTVCLFSDRLLFEKVWPPFIVKMLLKLYSIGYKSNE